MIQQAFYLLPNDVVGSRAPFSVPNLALTGHNLIISESFVIELFLAACSGFGSCQCRQ